MAHTEYLQLRIGQWQSSSDMDALMRAADHIDLLPNAERSAWTVDDARAAELVTAIQNAIAAEQDEIFNAPEIRYRSSAAYKLLQGELESQVWWANEAFEEAG